MWLRGPSGLGRGSRKGCLGDFGCGWDGFRCRWSGFRLDRDEYRRSRSGFGPGWDDCRWRGGGLGPGQVGCRWWGIALRSAGTIASGVGMASRSVETIAGGMKAASGLAGVVASVIEAGLVARVAGVKQNSSEAKPLSCEHLVGVRRFELLTSSVSGKRSPPELNARSRVRECAGNNITELPLGGKNYFKKLVNCGPIGARRSANSTRKVAFVPPMNCTFA